MKIAGIFVVLLMSLASMESKVIPKRNKLAKDVIPKYVEPVYGSTGGGDRSATCDATIKVYGGCGSTRYGFDLEGSKIVGGQNVPSANTYPFMVSLNGSNGHFCGGSLISGKYVATAAHCVEGESAGDFTVVLKEHDLSSEDGQEEEYNVTRITRHEGYDSLTVDNDIAILELDREAGCSGAIYLPRSSVTVLPNCSVTAIGWGATSEGGSSSDKLKHVILPLVSDADCKAAYPGEISGNMICAGLKEGGKDSCQGDSGGPLVLKNKDGKDVLVGIVSWGNGCAQPNSYGVYTKVSNYETWIRAKTGI